jgi:hypothetical protein
MTVPRTEVETVGTTVVCTLLNALSMVAILRGSVNIPAQHRDMEKFAKFFEVLIVF